MEYAGFWRRFGALWIDFVIFLPIMGMNYFFSNQTRLWHVYGFIPNALLGLWYHVYLVARYGGTPGKLVLNMRVAMADSAPVTIKAASFRYSVTFVLSTLLYLGFLSAVWQMTDGEYFTFDFMERGKRLAELAPPWYRTVNVLMQAWTVSEFVTMFFNKKRRALHDFMAGTVVIKDGQSSQAAENNAVQSSQAFSSRLVVWKRA